MAERFRWTILVVQLVGRRGRNKGGLSCPLLKIEKKCPVFSIYGLNSHLKSSFKSILGHKSHNVSQRGFSFACPQVAKITFLHKRKSKDFIGTSKVYFRVSVELLWYIASITGDRNWIWVKWKKQTKWSKRLSIKCLIIKALITNFDSSYLIVIVWSKKLFDSYILSLL